MRAVVQRVTRASIRIEGDTVGGLGKVWLYSWVSPVMTQRKMRNILSVDWRVARV